VTVTTEAPKPLTPAWTQLRPHAGQAALWTCPKRFIAVPAGRGSGKTELAKRHLVRCLADRKPWPDPKYFYAAPTHLQAKRNAWQSLLALIPDDWISGGRFGRNVQYSELTVTTIFGSQLMIVGMDKPHRLEGCQFDGGVLDESCDYRSGVFDRTVLPMLTHRNGWCWRIGVPKRNGTSAKEYREFFERGISGQDPEAAGYTWPSSDILPSEALRYAKENLDPKDYREQFEASWETAGGRIFYAFDTEYNVRPCQRDARQPIIVGSDFNVDPMAWVLGHKTENRLEWFDEIWLHDTNTQHALDVLVSRYGDHAGGFQFYGDATGRHRESSASRSDYQQILGDPRFIAKGRTVHYLKQNPDPRDRFAACNAMFCNAAGDRRMFVDPRCKRLIDDLNDRHYRPGTREPEDKGDLGHVTDAMGYACHRLFPIHAALITSGSVGMFTR